MQPLQGHFWGDEYVHYLGGSDEYTHMPKPIKSYTLNRSHLSYVNYTSIKLETKIFLMLPLLILQVLAQKKSPPRALP